jgi:hypothetical protein
MRLVLQPDHVAGRSAHRNGPVLAHGADSLFNSHAPMHSSRLQITAYKPPSQ